MLFLLLKRVIVSIFDFIHLSITRYSGYSKKVYNQNYLLSLTEQKISVTRERNIAIKKRLNIPVIEIFAFNFSNSSFSLQLLALTGCVGRKQAIMMMATERWAKVLDVCLRIHNWRNDDEDGGGDGGGSSNCFIVHLWLLALNQNESR